MNKQSKHTTEAKKNISNGLNNYYLNHPNAKKQRSESMKLFHKLHPEAAKNRKPGVGIYKRESWMKTGKYFRTEENRKNIGLAVKGRIDSVETREKKRIHMLAEWKANPNRFKPSRKGTKASAETILKLHYSHLGKSNGKKPLVGKVCPICNKIFYRSSYIMKTQIYCSHSCSMTGELNSSWVDGKYKKKYDSSFNKKLKEEIRTRDKYTCQLCNTIQIKDLKKFDVHHVDYDKKNSDKNNLITLCRKCHLMTNKNREKWKLFFQELMKQLQLKGGETKMAVLASDLVCECPNFEQLKLESGSFRWNPSAKGNTEGSLSDPVTTDSERMR